MSVTLWGSVITVRVSSAAPDAEPVWEDISEYVRIPKSQTLEAWLGRSTELPTTDPGKGRWFLLNNDDRFTPGNASSPYFPWWKQARRVQVIETLLDEDFVLLDGYLEIPMNSVWVQPVDPDEQAYLAVNVTAIDIIGRLKSGRKFQSALTEHIVYAGGGDLQGFWPMTQAAEPFTGYGPTTAALNMERTTSGTIAPSAGVQCQTGLAPTGAESLGARMVTVTNGSGRSFVRTFAPSTFTPAITTGQAFTAVFWWAFTSDMSSNNSSFHQIFSASVAGSSITLERNTTTGIWTLASATVMTGTVTAGPVGFEALLPVGIYWRQDTAAMELWIGGQRLTGTLTGVPAAGTVASLSLGFQVDYDLSNLQVYIGTDWSRTQFLEQVQQGYAPLHRQSTGERINTALDYAGFPAARRDVAGGVAVMSAATLAGKTAVNLIDEAVATERGRVFAQAGRIRFHDRTTVYNV